MYKPETIELLHVEGHRVSFDSITDEMFIGGEYAGRVLNQHEYVAFENVSGEFRGQVHENEFETWEAVVTWAAAISIGNDNDY